MLPFSASSQKCKLQKDEFTGEKIIEYSFGGKLVKFRTEAKKIYLEMRFQYNGEQNIIVPSKTELFIKLKNKQVIKLLTNKESPPTSTILASRITTLYTYEFQLSQDQLKALAEFDMDKIRYPNPEGGTLEFKSSLIKKHLSKGSLCLLENLATL